ncbi:MAG: LacI family DNA-binding transcriptional regulator [Bacillota bacterium]
MATIKDVAEHADVSVATVSAVINQDSEVNVSEELTRRVEKAVKELNYRPNRIARALSRKKTNTIAYIIPSIGNQFFAQMTELIEDLACEKDYGVYICNTGSGKDRVKLYMNNLIENKVDGVIVTLTWLIREYNFIETLQKENIPVVGLAGARVMKDIDTVIIDDEAGGRFAARYLVNKGYERIGFIGVKESRTTKKRLAGIKKYLTDNRNVSYEEDLVELGSDFSRSGGYNLAEKLLTRSPDIEAIIVYNDVMASGVLDKFAEAEIAVPEDIAVMGFDDSVAQFTRPKLTTMALAKEEMTSLAIKMLFDRIEGKKSSPRHKRVLPVLIERETT